MKKHSKKRVRCESIEVHEPVEHLKIWADTKIRLTTCEPAGKPVEMDAVQASGVADLLRRLSEPDFPNPPYERPESGYDALLRDVCVEFGFCGCIKDGRPLHVNWFIPSRGPVRADQFVEWVFLADNMNPNSKPERWQPLKDAIRAAFIKYMGADVVDATQFRLRARACS
jgi:hypothetical protein